MVVDRKLVSKILRFSTYSQFVARLTGGDRPTMVRVRGRLAHDGSAELSSACNARPGMTSQDLLSDIRFGMGVSQASRHATTTAVVAYPGAKPIERPDHRGAVKIDAVRASLTNRCSGMAAIGQALSHTRPAPCELRSLPDNPVGDQQHSLARRRLTNSTIIVRLPCAAEIQSPAEERQIQGEAHVH